MGESVFPHDGFGPLHLHAAHAGHDAGSADDFLRVDVVRDVSELPGAGAQGHDDFFQSHVSGAFADAVNGSFHLAGSGADGCQGVGYGQPKVIVAMHGDDGFADVRHIFFQVADDAVEFVRSSVAHSIRNVDGRGAGVDDCFHDFGQKIQVCAGSVLRGKFHILHELLGIGYAFRRHAQNFGFRFFQFELHVQLAGCQEDVDAGAFPGGFQGPGRRFNIRLHAAGQPCDAAFFDFAGDGVHGFKVAVGDAGKAGFNHVHAQPFHLPRHFQLFA